MHFLKDRGFVHPQQQEITPRTLYEQRRQWLKNLALGCGSSLTLSTFGARQAFAQTTRPGKLAVLTGTRSTIPGANAQDKLTGYADITSYNNYYEFGTDKSAPAKTAHTLKTRPWTVRVEGLVKNAKTYDLDELIKISPMEERIYRLRCVEGWSMVIPWVGYSLVELIKRAEPTGDAKFIEFTSLADPEQMPGLKSRVLSWPYVEGLRLDEAMHPLTLLTFGLYGEVLPHQNGAPVRLVVPWKYGFKSSKSIVKIRFTDKQPTTSWNHSAPAEYGFFSNVNPNAPHPRWDQDKERRIGEDGLFAKKRATQMFNGYEAQVGQLYAGMDLKKFF